MPVFSALKRLGRIIIEAFEASFGLQSEHKPSLNYIASKAQSQKAKNRQRQRQTDRVVLGPDF